MINWFYPRPKDYSCDELIEISIIVIVFFHFSHNSVILSVILNSVSLQEQYICSNEANYWDSKWAYSVFWPQRYYLDSQCYWIDIWNVGFNYRNSSWKLFSVSTILLPRNKSVLFNISSRLKFPSSLTSESAISCWASWIACRGFLGSMYIWKKKNCTKILLKTKKKFCSSSFIYQKLRTIRFPVFILIDQVLELLAAIFAPWYRLFVIVAKVESHTVGRKTSELVFSQLLIPITILNLYILSETYWREKLVDS